MSSFKRADMNFFDENQKITENNYGTIFSPGGEAKIGAYENQDKSSLYDPEVKDYLNRVRNKAIAKATSILKEAKQDADRLKEEAEKLHQEAEKFAEEAQIAGYDKGYSEGLEKGHQDAMEEAKDELEALRTGMADSTSAVLSAIEGQCTHIFDSWRDDILSVCRIAVEKISSIELKEERVEILSSLIKDSVIMLEKNRQLLIRVNPEDEVVIADIIESVRSRYPDIQSWDVRPDESISPGGLIVESEYSLAESLVESRRAAVDQILSHLSLPQESY